MDYIAAGEKRILDLHELEELRPYAYENAQIYKERTKNGMKSESLGENSQKGS